MLQTFTKINKVNLCICLRLGQILNAEDLLWYEYKHAVLP